MELPTITEQTLKIFHLKHFPATSLPQSLASVQYTDEEQEDELGYYPDGTKRTLTDDQIAMFRHSEIQQLLKSLRSQQTTSTQESRSTDDVGTASVANVTQTSDVQNWDKIDSNKWLGTEESTNRVASSQPRRAKKRKRPHRAPINGVRHDPEDYLEEGEERTYRRKCREADEKRTEIVLLDY